MTCREKLAKEHPELIVDGIVHGCPSLYGYLEDPKNENGAIQCRTLGCKGCWDREIEDVNISDILIKNVVEPTDDIPIQILTSEEETLIKDSGDRTKFESGAVRDMHAGKGDMVSLPSAAILRLSKHYENGALKYGRWNYTKGIPISSFLDSALRHLFKYLDGWDDEDHLSAAAFNVLGAMEMEAHHKELNDLPSREGKNRFDYTRG